MGVDPAALMLAATLSPLANGGGRVFWGYVSDRLGREQTMTLAFSLQAACLLLVVLVGRASAAWFVLTLIMVYFTWGEIYSLFPSLGRLFRPPSCHVELQRALHRQGRGGDRRRLVGRDPLRAIRQLVPGLLRQRRHGARRGRAVAVGLRAARVNSRAPVGVPAAAE